MTYDELTEEQKTLVAAEYLCRLADEGAFAEVMDVDYDAPSWVELAHALYLVPQDVLEREYEGVCFSEDDFC